MSQWANSELVRRGKVPQFDHFVGAILLEQNNKWAVQGARYMTLETIAPLSDDPAVSFPPIASWPIRSMPANVGYTTPRDTISFPRLPFILSFGEKAMDCCSMHCCSHGHLFTRRQWMWSTAVASVAAMLGGGVGPYGSTAAAQTAETASAALEVLRNSISVDVHTHGGTTGIVSQAPPNDDLAKGMRAGSLAVACLADVPDGPILKRNEAGVLTAGTPQPGQLYKYHLDRLDWVDEMIAHHGLRRALSATDLEAAHAAGDPAVVSDVEGLDFLEGKMERLEEAHQRGVRHVQLVHYTPNDIGDFQTGTVTHHGLTSFGAEVIRACHRLGFVCDVAHATEDTVKAAVKVATKPLLLSHTALSGSPAMGPTPLTGRQISRDHAQAIAETGGAIGIWHFFPSIEKYVDGLKEMVDVVGVNHVCVGTDQQVAPGALQDYSKWVHLVGAMLTGGFTPEEAGKIAGGNYMRIFRTAVS